MRLSKKTASLFILCGPSGTGKTTLLHYLKNKKIKNFSFHKKDTTRAPRKSEIKAPPIELRFVKNLSRPDYLLTYQHFGYSYGIRKDILFEALNKKEKHFLILNNLPVIKKIKGLFPQSTIVYIHSDLQDLLKRIRLRDGEERLKQVKSVFLREVRNYEKNKKLFDIIIDNSSSLTKTYKQIWKILKT